MELFHSTSNGLLDPLLELPRLESPDGRPLSPPMPVSGHVTLATTDQQPPQQAAPCARPAAAVPAMAQVS